MCPSAHGSAAAKMVDAARTGPPRPLSAPTAATFGWLAIRAGAAVDGGRYRGILVARPTARLRIFRREPEANSVLAWLLCHVVIEPRKRAP
jgi:hypothetical protein